MIFSLHVAAFPWTWTKLTKERIQVCENDSTFLIPLYPDPVSDMYAPLMFWEDDWKKIPFDWFNGEKAAYIVPKTPNGYIVNLSKIHSIMNHTPFHRYNLQIRFTTKQKDLFNG